MGCIIVFSAACGAGGAVGGGEAVDEPVEIALDGEPVADIGEVDGDPAYLLHRATGAVRLSDGRLAVLNAGTREVRIYGAHGAHEATVGGEGGGPGELRAPARIRLLRGDTILVLDQATNMESAFGSDGEFIDVEALKPRAGSPFTGDTWLRGRNYVTDPDGVVDRSRIGAVLDGLPAPGPGAYRFVRVDRDRRLWIRTEPADPAAASRWDVRSAGGARLASVVTPAGFRLLDAGSDFVVGRVLDTLDVEHVQAYEFAPIGDSGSDGPPGAAPGDPMAGMNEPEVGGPGGGPDAGGAGPVKAAVDEAILEAMRSMLRTAMAQQEIYYSSSGTWRYASRASELEWPDDMQGLTVHILDGSDRGWTMIVVHEAANVMCGAAMGSGGPVGWTPGLVVCPAA